MILFANTNISEVFIPIARQAHIIAPILVPAISVGIIPFSSRKLIIPRCANPLAAPHPNTTPNSLLMILCL